MVQFKFSDSNVSGGIGKHGGKALPGPLASLSVDDIRDFILQYKIEMVCAGFVVLTGFCVLMFVSGQMAKIKLLNDDIQAMSDKEAPVHELKTIEDAAPVLSDMPKALPENKFISYLTAFANKRDVVITAITPPENINAGFFQRSVVKVSCMISGFQDALLFLNDIEQSEYAIKVDSWKVLRSSDTGDVRSKYKNDQKLLVVMTVSSIEILDNEKK